MQPDRTIQIAAFLDQNGWRAVDIQGFDGDFSPRRYARLTMPDGRQAILMDADLDQQTPKFISIANCLRGCEIQTPQIYAALPDQGLVLMQDFGSRNIGGLWDAGAEPRPFFLRAAELLARLHRRFDLSKPPVTDLPLFDSLLFTTQAELFLDGYIPFALKREVGLDERQSFCAAWQSVLRPLDAMPQSLLLRDFMTDNLMDLPNDQLGVLDFQDAGIGPTAYDLASLCEEVRRDGGFALLPDVIAHYRKTLIALGDPSPLPADDLLRAGTILSAQRHTRILGIVTRVALRTGKQDKLAYIPRILEHLRHILAQPYLTPVREWMENFESMNR